MPLEPENECPTCGEWKNEDFELCRTCSETEQDRREDAVLLNYSARVRSTDKATLFRIGGSFTGKDLWVPKSQILDEDPLARTVCVPRWWAEDNDLAYQDE